MTTEIATVVSQSRSMTLSVDDVLHRLDTIQDLMKRAMVPDVDYGKIPGTNSKPTLLKPGAEKLAVMFRLAPRFKTDKTFHDDGHMTVESTCEILDSEGRFLGQCSSMCSSREAKYAWRKSERVCPECGKPAIIKGRSEYGGGWLCFKKKDGCGAKFADNDAAIVSQTTGRAPNEDLADTFNTVLRMAEKRAFLGAIRLVTGSSALFDEEIPGERERPIEEPVHEPKPKEKPPTTIEEKKAWLLREIPNATSETTLDKYRAGIARETFSPDDLNELSFSWFKAALILASTTDKIGELQGEIIKSEFGHEQSVELMQMIDERLAQLTPHKTVDPDGLPF